MTGLHNYVVRPVFSLSVRVVTEVHMVPQCVRFSSIRYSSVLTSMPLSERPFLYDIIGGSLKKLKEEV